MQDQAPRVCGTCRGSKTVECGFCHGTCVMQLGDTLYCSDTGCQVCPACRGEVRPLLLPLAVSGNVPSKQAHRVGMTLGGAWWRLLSMPLKVALLVQRMLEQPGHVFVWHAPRALHAHARV